MKKHTLNLAISAALAASATWGSFASEQDNIEHLVITATRTPQDQRELLASVIVIDRKDIELLQPASMADLLNRTAGITLAPQGGPAHSNSVYIRGTNSNHTLLLIDGLRVGSATLGSKSLQDLSPSQIERIEIVKGPKAALYGSDAIGGVIQIFTRDLAPEAVQVALGIGTDSLRQADFAAGFEVAGSKNTVSVSDQRSDGFSVTDGEPDDDGYQQQAASLKGSIAATDTLSFDWLGRLEKGDYDYDSSYENQSYYNNRLIALGANVKLNNTQIRFEAAQSKDEQQGYGNGIAKGKGSRFQTLLNQFNTRIQSQLSEQVSVVAGVDLQWQEIETKTTYAENKRLIQGYYLGTNATWQSLLFDAAMRYDDIENLDHEITYNTSVGYPFRPGWLLSLNYGTGFKAASFNDLYSPFGGNPDLKSETSATYELLLKGEQQGVTLEMALYQTQIDDLIAWAPIAPGSFIWSPGNVNQADIKGMDISLKTKAFYIDWLMNATFLDTQDKSTGKDLLRRPEQSLSYAGSYSHDRWQVSMDINYQSHSFDSNDVRLPSYTLLNGFVAYQFSNQWLIKGYGRNLFNKTYQAVNGYNTAGRELGVTLALDF